MSASTRCGWRNGVRQPLPACTGVDCLLTYGSVMSALEAAEQLLANLSRAEKAQVLQWAARDLGDAFPGIESRPGVCGGEPCIVRTRIPAWVLEQARRLGTSEAELLRIYPTLRAEDLANVWAYVRSHGDEISRQIEANEAD
jgi:uncharacterized protein (DUF433 family)